ELATRLDPGGGAVGEVAPAAGLEPATKGRRGAVPGAAGRSSGGPAADHGSGQRRCLAPVRGPGAGAGPGARRAGGEQDRCRDPLPGPDPPDQGVRRVVRCRVLSGLRGGGRIDPVAADLPRNHRGAAAAGGRRPDPSPAMSLSRSIKVAGKGLRELRRGGAGAAMTRTVRFAYRRLGVESLEVPLLSEDIADSTRLDLPVPPIPPDRGSRLTVGWVTNPPSLGSGGHTTMFRMIAGLEAAGHRCVIFLYDRYGGDVAQHRMIIRRGWPEIRAEVLDADDGVAGVDAAVATGWESAHVLARRGTAPMRRLYFVQDYEPYFYPRGPEYALAEDTYRFGF